MRAFAAFLIVALCSVPMVAQAPTADQQKIAALEAKVKKLQTLPADVALKQAQEQIAKDLKALRDQVAPGCHAIGGKWTIQLDPKGQVTSVTCTQK